MTGLFTALHDALFNISFADIGANIVAGIKNGISGAWDKFKEWLGNLLGDELIKWVKKKLGIESPSKVFRDQVGKWILPGVSEGVEASMPDTLRSLKACADDLVDSMSGLFSVGARLTVDDSAVKNYSANYGADFTDAAITHKVKQQMSLNSQIQADIDGGRFKEQIREALEEVITGRLDNMAVDVRRTADKDPRTVVNIGGRTVADEVQRQKSANGFMFTPSFG